MLELFIALSAGLISFLSPCVLPLIPGYVSYISGSSLNELLESKKTNIFPIILFSLGFSIVFISFGATATFLGSLVLDYSYELRIIAGIFIIIFSLQIIGLITIQIEIQFLPMHTMRLEVIFMLNLYTARAQIGERMKQPYTWHQKTTVR